MKTLIYLGSGMAYGLLAPGGAGDWQWWAGLAALCVAVGGIVVTLDVES